MLPYFCDFKVQIYILEYCGDPKRLFCEIMALQIFSKDFDTQLLEGQQTSEDVAKEYLPMVIEDEAFVGLIKEAKVDECYEIVGTYHGQGTYNEYTGEHDFKDEIGEFDYVKYEIDEDNMPVIVKPENEELNIFKMG